MELKEAIEVLKMNRPLIGRIGDEVMEAIDTVVEHLENPLPTDEEIIERANEAYPGEEIVPHFQRVGFTFGAK